MNNRFAAHVEALPPLLERLLALPAVTVTTLPLRMPTRGVYLFSEGLTHLYVGRSNRMRQRLRNHGGPNAAWRQAAFAFRLAREATGNTKASYKPEGSRKDLMKDPVFVSAFNAAKARIAQMDARFVEATDPLCQCLLEIYVAVTLETQYNDFDNH